MVVLENYLSLITKSKFIVNLSLLKISVMANLNLYIWPSILYWRISSYLCFVTKLISYSDYVLSIGRLSLLSGFGVKIISPAQFLLSICRSTFLPLKPFRIKISITFYVNWSANGNMGSIVNLNSVLSNSYETFAILQIWTQSCNIKI